MTSLDKPFMCLFCQLPPAQCNGGLSAFTLKARRVDLLAGKIGLNDLPECMRDWCQITGQTAIVDGYASTLSVDNPHSDRRFNNFFRQIQERVELDFLVRE